MVKLRGNGTDCCRWDNHCRRSASHVSVVLGEATDGSSDVRREVADTGWERGLAQRPKYWALSYRCGPDAPDEEGSTAPSAIRCHQRASGTDATGVRRHRGGALEHREAQRRDACA